MTKLSIALWQPEIPPNTGNIMRLAANTGVDLHLIHPLGFSLDEKKVRRAGMDYRELQLTTEHQDTAAFFASMANRRILGFTTKGGKHFHEIEYEDNDVLLFGPETRGLSQEIRDQLGAGNCLRIPMQQASRSLNLSNTVSIAVFEALRQLNYPGLV